MPTTTHIHVPRSLTRSLVGSASVIVSLSLSRILLCVCVFTFARLNSRPTYCHWMLYVFIKLQQFHPICCDTQPYTNPIVALMKLLTVSFSHRISCKVTNSADALTICEEQYVCGVAVYIFFFFALSSRDNVEEKKSRTPETNKCTTD